jgi:transposase-like protein
MVQEEEVPMGRRRRFTPVVNARVVLELVGVVKSLAEACREYQLKPQRLARWKGEFLDKAPRVFRGTSERTPRGHESRSESGWSDASAWSWK